MSSDWSMESILSDTSMPKEEKEVPATKSTLQLLAAAKPKPTPSTPVTGVTPLTPLTPVSKSENSTVAPTKNFQKVSNTITREAIPSGVFKSGKVKQLYDVLYSLTRGAFTPVRTVRVSKPRLQKLSGIGAPQTLNAGLMHLQLVGLLKINAVEGGSHEGNEYEVFLYEETQTGVTGLTPVRGVTGARNLDPLPPSETYPRKGSLNAENTDSSENAKTSFLKTIVKSDDERTIDGLSILATKLDAAAKKITGKGISKNEAEKWGSLADLLILELEIAASRSNGVSSVPSFLTEVLRRQFFSTRQLAAKPSKPNSKTKPDLVGKPNEESFEIKPLDEQGRENSLIQLQEFADADFLGEFEQYYTSDDWKWLMKKLKG